MSRYEVSVARDLFQGGYPLVIQNKTTPRGHISTSNPSKLDLEFNSGAMYLVWKINIIGAGIRNKK